MRLFFKGSLPLPVPSPRPANIRRVAPAAASRGLPGVKPAAGGDRAQVPRFVCQPRSRSATEPQPPARGFQELRVRWGSFRAAARGLPGRGGTAAAGRAAGLCPAVQQQGPHQGTTVRWVHPGHVGQGLPGWRKCGSVWREGRPLHNSTHTVQEREGLGLRLLWCLPRAGQEEHVKGSWRQQ